MRTEQQIQEEIQRQQANLRSAGDYRDGDSVDKHSYWLEALRWVLNSPPPEPPRFVCPKCGKPMYKVEPASGYYKYLLDMWTGEAMVTNDDFNCQTHHDTWYECTSCRSIASPEWSKWYESEVGDIEEEGETQEDFSHLREKFSEESQPSQD